ncbi:MAG: histidine triad nucleotide-binding protein [Planctomycetota bacterium]
MSDCLFCSIVQGEIPSDEVARGEDWYAFRDIDPKAPTHVLIIPDRHIASIHDVTPDDAGLLGRMVVAARDIAEGEGIASGGYRLVWNVGSHGGQAVFHIHLHLLGGRPFAWPPG